MRQWNNETINEQLKLHKKQNKDERYNYFSREFNSLWYCWELERYTISLQNQLQQKDKEIERLNKKILTLEETIRKANNNVLKDISMIKMHEMVKQEIVQRLVETSKILESRSDKE